MFLVENLSLMALTDEKIFGVTFFVWKVFVQTFFTGKLLGIIFSVGSYIRSNSSLWNRYTWKIYSNWFFSTIRSSLKNGEAFFWVIFSFKKTRSIISNGQNYSEKIPYFEKFFGVTCIYRFFFGVISIIGKKSFWVIFLFEKNIRSILFLWEKLFGVNSLLWKVFRSNLSLRKFFRSNFFIGKNIRSILFLLKSYA